jgi:hypothetical protein
MAKIVKNKVTGLVGFVLVELNEGWDVVGEDGSYERYPENDLEVIGETADINIPPVPSPTIQSEVVALALSALGKFKMGEKT